MKEIPEFPNYLITAEGKIWSLVSNKYKSSYLNNKGYPCVKLYKNGTPSTCLLHRLLARVYKDLPSLYSELEVDHKDNNPLNYSLENIQVLTTAAHLEKTLKERGFEVSNITCVCGASKDRGALHCKKCASALLVKHKEVTAEQIEFWVRNYSWVRAGKELGYSDNGLRKRYTALSGKDPKSIKRV